MEDKYFMKEALKESEVALKEGNWPIGCVIELDGKIIARAHNQVYTLTQNRPPNAKHPGGVSK